MSKSKEFVTSSDEDTSDEDLSDSEPKPKKMKVETDVPVAKKAKKVVKSVKKAVKLPEGENMFQLSKMRFVNVSQFRGKVMVGIREYYEVDGDLRPGKKGISLNVEQWNALKNQVDQIDEVIKKT